MNIKKIVTSPVFWSVIALVSSACWCGEDTTTQSAKILSAPETQEPPQAKVFCPMEWTSPSSSSDAGEMPATGKIAFDWTDNPGAQGYKLTVLTPNGSPVYYDVDGSSKDLFLENFKMAGDYQVIVTGLAEDGSDLCSITMNFNKPEVSLEKPAGNTSDENDNAGGGGVNPPIIVPIATDDPPK